jgi:zinc protease
MRRKALPAVWLALHLTALAAAGGAAADADEPVRDERLANGVRVIAQRRPGCGTFGLQVIALGGRAEDPAERFGLTDLLARMLLRGSVTRTGEQQALEVERAGATLEATGATLGVMLRAAGPAAALPAAFEVLSDAALHPRLEPEDLTKEIALARQRLGRSLDLSSTLRERAMLPLLFGEHPLGRVADPEDYLAGIGIEAVRQAHAARFTGRRLIVVVTGDFEIGMVGGRAAASLGALPAGDGPAASLPRPAPLPEPRRQRVHRRTAQPEIAVAFPTDGAGETDEPALDLLAHILGGFEERLSGEIREQRGWAYWLSVLDWRFPGAGAFGILTAVPKKHLPETERIILEELRRIASTAPPDEEVERARRYLLTTLARTWQQSAGRAALFASAAVRGRPLRTYEETAALYAGVTPGQIRLVAGRIIAWSQPVIVELY